jgi:hypothetical protein
MLFIQCYIAAVILLLNMCDCIFKLNCAMVSFFPLIFS